MSQLLKWSNLRNNKIYLALCPTTKFIESYFQMVEAMSERNKLDTRRCRRRKEESHTRHITNIPVTGVWNSDSVSEIHGGRCAFDHVRGRRRTEGRRGTVKREREREREREDEDVSYLAHVKTGQSCAGRERHISVAAGYTLRLGGTDTGASMSEDSSLRLRETRHDVPQEWLPCAYLTVCTTSLHLRRACCSYGHLLGHLGNLDPASLTTPSCFLRLLLFRGCFIFALIVCLIESIIDSFLYKFFLRRFLFIYLLLLLLSFLIFILLLIG